MPQKLRPQQEKELVSFINQHILYCSELTSWNALEMINLKHQPVAGLPKRRFFSASFTVNVNSTHPILARTWASVRRTILFDPSQDCCWFLVKAGASTPDGWSGGRGEWFSGKTLSEAWGKFITAHPGTEEDPIPE